MSTNEELIGRADVNDLQSILSISNRDVDEVVHAVKDSAEAIFTWDYEKGHRPALNKLYEKAKTSQWNGETDLPWDTVVDQEKVVLANAANNNGLIDNVDVSGTPFAAWTEDDWIKLGVDPKEAVPPDMMSRQRQVFQEMLYSKI